MPCRLYSLLCLLLAGGASIAHGVPATAPVDAKPWTIGVLPVSAVVRVDQLPLRPALETALDTHLLGLDAVQVVDRAHVALFLDELVRSKVNRRDLKVGQIVGAEVLIASQLTAGREKDVELKLSAIETATGTVLLEKSTTLAGGAAESIDPAVRSFTAELVQRRPAAAPRVDVAVLPIGYAGPIPQDASLTDGTRQRLGQALAANPALRVLHREMGQFVLNESALAAGGLVDPKRKFAPVAGVVLVEGTLTQALAQGKSLDESTLTLKLTVRRQGQQGQPITVQAQGTFADAGKLEQEIIGKVSSAVAEITGKQGVAAPAISPDIESANRHWEAQRYIQEAKQIIRLLSTPPTANDAKNQLHAFDLLIRAANLAPDDPRFYAVLWQKLAAQNRFGPSPIDGACKERAHTLRVRFLDGFPSHPIWPTAVLEELTYLHANDKQTPEEREASVALAGRFADVVLARQTDLSFKFGDDEDAIGYAPENIVRDTAAALMADGQFDRAWQLTIAGADMIDDANVEPEGWQAINDFLIRAIHLDHLDHAWRAAQYMQVMYPGYRPMNFNSTWNYRTTPLQKIRAAGQLEKWEPFINIKEHGRGRGDDTRWLSAQLHLIEAAGEPHTVDLDPTELTGRAAYALPGSRLPGEGRRYDPRIGESPNPIVAMTPGEHPWCVVRMSFFAKDQLWRVGAKSMTEITGAPKITAGGFIDRHGGYLPALVEFDGALYVTTVGEPVYRIDPATARATLAAPGLPTGHVAALLVHDNALYACGGSGGDEARDPGRGFVARLDRGATAWKVWTAPPKLGQIHDLAAISKPGDKPESLALLLYHRATLRATEFHPAEPGDAAWKELGSIRSDGTGPVGFAVSGSSIVRWDELTVYRFDREPKLHLANAYVCPPFTPGTHYWMYQPSYWWIDLKGLGGGKKKPPSEFPVPPWQVAAATLGSPTDIAADPEIPGRFWIVDKFGGLSILDATRGVAGPFKAAERCFRLAVNKQSVCISTGVGIVEIPRPALDARLAQPDAWKTPEQVYRTALERLDAWAEKLPAITRGVLYATTHQLDRAEKIFAEAGDTVPLTARLGWLIADKKYPQALALMEPYLRDVEKLTDPALESQILNTLSQAGEWKRLVEFIPRLWKESPLRGAAVNVSERTNGYLFAQKHLLPREAYQREVAEILAGKLPETPWKWDENPVYRCFARDIRRWAWLESPKKSSLKSVLK